MTRNWGLFRRSPMSAQMSLEHCRDHRAWPCIDKAFDKSRMQSSPCCTDAIPPAPNGPSGPEWWRRSDSYSARRSRSLFFLARRKGDDQELGSPSREFGSSVGPLSYLYDGTNEKEFPRCFDTPDQPRVFYLYSRSPPSDCHGKHSVVSGTLSILSFSFDCKCTWNWH
jgi:hypothetical protein